MPIDIVWQGGLSRRCWPRRSPFAFSARLLFALGPALKFSRSAVIGDLKEQAGEDAARSGVGNFCRAIRWSWCRSLSRSRCSRPPRSSFAARARRLRSIPVCRRARITSWKSTRASAAYDQTRAQDLYRTLGGTSRALSGRRARQHLRHGSVRDDHDAAKRCGAPASNPAPDAKPATAAEGLRSTRSGTASARIISRRWDCRCCAAALSPLAEATQHCAGRGDHRRSAREKTMAGRRRARPANSVSGQWKALARTAKEGSGEMQARRTDRNHRHCAGDRGTGCSKKSRAARSTCRLPAAFRATFSFMSSSRRWRRARNSATADLIRRTVREVDPMLFRSSSLKTFAQHLDGNLAALDRPRGRGVVQRLRRPGAWPGACRRLWRESLLRRAAHPRNRHPDGARRATRDGAMDDPARRRRDVDRWRVARPPPRGGTGKLVSSILYEVSALDPLAFTIAPIVLAVAALLATWLPARRATRISPDGRAPDGVGWGDCRAFL